MEDIPEFAESGEVNNEGYFTNVKDPEMVDHPDHYKGMNGFEAINVIEAYGLNFNLGNVIKYILRADRKGRRLEDLKKAKWYLQREIERVNIE